MESLETRELLAARVFVDFGDNFSSGVLNTTAANWVSTAKGVDFSAAATNISIQRFSNISAISSLGATAISTIRSELLAQVAKYFEPFDVVVQTASATSVTDIANTLNSTDGSGDNDSYIVLGRYYNTSTGAALRSSGILGQAAGLDLSTQTNSTEETASVFADNLMTWLGSGVSNSQIANAFSFIVAHEVGHTFGLRHTANPPTPGDSSDIMTQNPTAAQAMRNDNFFSAVFMNNDIGGTYVPFDKLTTNVGPKLNNILYATGSGASDIITISFTGTQIRIDVPGHADSGSIPTTSLFNYSTYPVGPYPAYNFIIEGGFGDDLIVFDSSIANLTYGPVTFTVIGGTGSDKIQYFDTSAANTHDFNPATVSTNGNFGSRVKFDASTENVEYFSNGGNDVVNAIAGNLTQLTVRNNTASGNVYVKATGTSSADIATFVAAPVSGLGSLTVGSNLPILFNDKVYAVEYYSNGGNDVINATPGSTNIFSAFASGVTSTQVYLKVNGTSGADAVTINPTPSPSFEAIVVGSLKPIFFNSQVYALEYYTVNGADTITVNPSANTIFSLFKSAGSTGNVAGIVNGTTGADTATFLPDPVSASSALAVSGKQPIFFTNTLNVVEFHGNGGSDVVYVTPSTTTFFSVIGAAYMTVYGTSGNDTATLNKPNPTYGAVTFSTGSFKTVYFASITTEMKIDMGAGNDTLYVDVAGEVPRYSLVGGLGTDTLSYLSGSVANLLYEDFEIG